MPAPLSTSKRKFHKLLDSISNASSSSLPLQHERSNTSTTTLPNQSEHPSKKLRFLRPASAHASSTKAHSRLSESITRPTSVAKQKDLSKISSKEPKPLPNFAPWDRSQFLGRLKTYRHVDKWTGKPDKINEVEWARRGWSCVGKETVGCLGGCGKEVVIKLEDETERRVATETGGSENGEEEVEEEEQENEEWRDKAQEELVDRYSEMISTAHEEGCLWRRRGCDDTIQRLPVIQYSSAIEGLQHRYKSLRAMASELPKSVTTPRMSDYSNLIQQIGTLLDKDLKSISAEDSSTISASNPSNDDSAPSNTTALSLALFGWQAEENHIAGLITCSACFRRLGLWLFRPSTIDSTDSSMDHLDVFAEHRDYCPWINSISQNGGTRRSSIDSLAGWEALLRTLSTRKLDPAPREGESQNGNSQGHDEEVPKDATSFDQNLVNDDDAVRDQKDKERWAKLKRVSQIFNLRKGKPPPSNVGSLVT